MTNLGAREPAPGQDLPEREPRRSNSWHLHR
jgi:hypothetical protein